MKIFFLCILAVIALLVMTDTRAQEEEVEEEAAQDGYDEEEYLNELIAECQSLENTSDVDVSLLRKKEMPTSEEARCLTGCMYERITFLLNGKLCRVNTDYVCEEVLETKLKATNEACIKSAKGYDKCEDGPLLLACMLTYDPDYEIFPAE